MMLPKVLNERQVHLFKFYRDEEVNQGMRHSRNLYRLVDRMGSHDRLKAYEMAMTLTDLGYPAIITVSNHYCIWVPITAQTGTQLDTDLITSVTALVKLKTTIADTISAHTDLTHHHSIPADSEPRPAHAHSLNILSQQAIHVFKLLLEGGHYNSVHLSDL